MDEGLIEVEHQGVDWPIAWLQRVEERRRHFGQICEVVGEDGRAGRGDGRGLQDSKWILASQAGLALVAEHFRGAL